MLPPPPAILTSNYNTIPRKVTEKLRPVFHESPAWAKVANFGLPNSLSKHGAKTMIYKFRDSLQKSE